ncbi:unnamed protein product, partial [Porites lobata]
MRLASLPAAFSSHYTARSDRILTIYSSFLHPHHTHILPSLLRRPPYDNYYNISKAVYPSVDLPSLLIKITVKFPHDSGNLTHLILAASSRSPINGSTSNISQTEENVLETTETKITTYKFTWSASCLYVSGGSISLASMRFLYIIMGFSSPCIGTPGGFGQGGAMGGSSANISSRILIPRILF